MLLQISAPVTNTLSECSTVSGSLQDTRSANLPQYAYVTGYSLPVCVPLSLLYDVRLSVPTLLDPKGLLGLKCEG